MIRSPTKNLGQQKSFKMFLRRNSNTFFWGSKDLEFGVLFFFSALSYGQTFEFR